MLTKTQGIILVLFVFFIVLALLTILAMTNFELVHFILTDQLGENEKYSQADPIITSPTQYPIISATFTPFLPEPTFTQTPRPARTSKPTRTPTPTASATPPPTATSTPTPGVWPPEATYIEGLYGFPQTYNLSCESRSAVDWARFFGKDITEQEFLDALPRSDNPQLGFVGSPYGMPGQTPPYSYGVHAQPVAGLLRAYGLSAQDVYNFSDEEIMLEIAEGRPVIAWVISSTLPGWGFEYYPEEGDPVLVAPYEHTVIVFGYDSGGVHILDNSWVYWRSWDMFSSSFSVLGKMAIILQP